MASADQPSEALRINAFDMHRAEVLMLQRRRLRPRHATLVSFAAKYHYVESQRRLVAAAGMEGCPKPLILAESQMASVRAPKTIGQKLVRGFE